MSSNQLGSPEAACASTVPSTAALPGAASPRSGPIMKEAPRNMSWRLIDRSRAGDTLSSRPDPFVYLPARECPQDPLRIPPRHTAQFPGTHRFVPPGQKDAKHRINQGKVIVDVVRLLTAVDVKDVLETVNPPYLAGSLIDPIDLLLSPHVLAKGLLVLPAKMRAQLCPDVPVVPVPPIVVDVQRSIKRGLDQLTQRCSNRHLSHRWF